MAGSSERRLRSRACSREHLRDRFDRRALGLLLRRMAGIDKRSACVYIVRAQQRLPASHRR